MTRPPAKGAPKAPASKKAPEPPPKAPPPPRPKAQIGAAAFGALRAAIGEDTRGEAMRVPLADIDEDPNQPRRAFDEGELESLAESIRERGVLQPVVVRHGLGGRWTLVMGARRLRASRLAGAADIPAVIQRGGDGDDYAAQVIENQQRRDLLNSELAAAVLRFAAEGRTTRQIGTICNLKDYQVAAFRKADEFPPELRARMDEGDMRALYDLYRQWTKTPAEVLAALPEPGTFLTVTEARRIVGAITGKPTGSIVLDRAPSPLPAPEPPAPAAEPAEPNAGPAQANVAASPAEAPASEAGAGRPAAAAPAAPPLTASPSGDAAEPPAPLAPGASVAPRRAPPPSPRAPAPVFVVRTREGIEGRLVVDRRAERAGWALVEIGGLPEEIDPAELVLARVE